MFPPPRQSATPLRRSRLWCLRGWHRVRITPSDHAVVSGRRIRQGDYIVLTAASASLAVVTRRATISAAESRRVVRFPPARAATSTARELARRMISALVGSSTVSSS